MSRRVGGDNIGASNLAGPFYRPLTSGIWMERGTRVRLIRSHRPNVPCGSTGTVTKNLGLRMEVQFDSGITTTFEKRWLYVIRPEAVP